MPTQEELIAQIMAAPEVIQEEYTPSEEELAREREIWSRINRGPRERGDELTAKAWKDRYGVTESSRKGRRIAAGIGEILRGIAGGSQYQSIPDQSFERGLKEYQTEIGPLQRELGVLSNSRIAYKKLHAQQLAARDKNDISRYNLLRNVIKDDATIQKILGVTPEQLAKIKKLEAETSRIAAETTGKNLTNTALGQTGGFQVGGKTAENLGLANILGKNPDLAENALRIGHAQSAKPIPGSRYDTIQGSRVQTVQGSDGSITKVEVPTQRTVRVPTQGPDQFPAALADIMQRARRAQGALGQPQEAQGPQTPLPGPQTPQQPPQAIQQGIPGEAAPQPAPGAQPVQSPLAQAIQPPRQSGVQSGRVIHAPNLLGYQDFVDGEYRKTIAPSNKAELSRVTGIPTKNFQGWYSPRWEGERIPNVGKKSDAFQAAENYHSALNGLARSTTNEFMDGKLDNISGILANLKNSFKAVTGGLPPEALDIRLYAVETVAQKILQMSGKAVTDTERAFLSQALPKLSTDNAATTVMKSIALKHILDIRDLQSKLRITEPELEQLYGTQSGRAMLEMPKLLFTEMEKLKNSNVRGVVEILGVKFPSRAAAKAAITNQLSAKNLQGYIRRALKEAGIEDVIPLN